MPLSESFVVCVTFHNGSLGARPLVLDYVMHFLPQNVSCEMHEVTRLWIEIGLIAFPLPSAKKSPAIVPLVVVKRLSLWGQAGKSWVRTRTVNSGNDYCRSIHKICTSGSVWWHAKHGDDAKSFSCVTQILMQEFVLMDAECTVYRFQLFPLLADFITLFNNVLSEHKWSLSSHF